jgi:hypothetical protein
MKKIILLLFASLTYSFSSGQTCDKITREEDGLGRIYFASPAQQPIRFFKYISATPTYWIELTLISPELETRKIAYVEFSDGSGYLKRDIELDIDPSGIENHKYFASIQLTSEDLALFKGKTITKIELAEIVETVKDGHLYSGIFSMPGKR